MSDQVVEAAEPSSRRRKQWRQIAVQDVPSEQFLRVAAQTWLKQKAILHKTLTNSSFEKKVVLIARCYECESCSHQWRFGWTDQGSLRVEESGECSEKKHVARLKRHYAKEFAKEGTPLRVFKHMKRKNISEAHRPSIAQIKSQRHKESIARRLDGYSVECVGELMDFVNSPPPDVEILKDYVVRTPDRIVVPFTLILSEWRDLVDDAAVTWLVPLAGCPTVITCQVHICLTMTDAIMDNSACFPMSENEYFCSISLLLISDMLFHTLSVFGLIHQDSRIESYQTCFTS